MKLREDGNKCAAELLNECTSSSPRRSSRILKKWKKAEVPQTPLSPEEALSLMITLNLSKEAYNTLRSTANSHGHRLYPSYRQIVQVKEQFYPDGTIVSEQKCEVPLQNLLYKTCESVVNVIPPCDTSDSENELTLFCKWGFDGSSGFSCYEQKSNTSEDKDGSIFVTSLVPLRLVDNKTNEIVWKNVTPSSTRSCRPIRIQWIQETNEISRKEEIYINEQIQSLEPFKSRVGSINFSLLLTMVDGKVCNALAGASGMRCYICKATISELNLIQSMRERPSESDMYRFGLSVLHAYIRFFECMLHISYRLDLKTWKVPKDKRSVFEERKNIVQGRFRQDMGLLVDIPKPGYGTTNDGNTARKFFANPQISSRVTVIDENLITRLGVILRVINSGYEIRAKEFESYCLLTAQKYVELYDWYYMPVTLHKVLIHGPTIIKNAIIPIGELSEEAQEAKNKDIRYFREHHTRKTSRVKTNEDLFQRLLLSSDPYLSAFKHMKNKKRKVDKDIVHLIVVPRAVNNTNVPETEVYSKSYVSSSEDEM